MKSVSKKRIILGMATIMMVASMFASCSQNSVSDAEIAQMQTQLDSITAQYEKMKVANVEFGDKMSAKDQEIEAKTAEINDLLNQLRVAKEAKNNAEMRARKADNGVSSQHAGECAEKKALEKQIKTLESQIAKLEKKLQTQISTQKSNNDEAIETINGKLKVKEGELKSMGEELRAKQNELNEKSNELANKNAEIQKQAGELQKLQSELAVAIAASNNSKKSNETANNAEVIRLKEQIASQESQINGLNNEVKRLTSDMEALNVQLSSKNVDNSAVSDMEKQLAELRIQLEQKEAALALKDKSIADANSRVVVAEKATAEAKKALSEAKQEASKMAKASPRTINKKLAELQDLCDGYVAELESLRLENEKLKVENEELHDQMCSLRKDSEQAIEDNMKLVQKVALASVLVTNNMEATPGKSIVSGTVIKPSKKASTTNVVRLSFDILDNNVVDPGTIELYARIATAANRVVCNGNPSEFTFDMNGVNMNYTMKQDIEFSGKSRKVVMMWKRSEQVELTSGLYWVTVYANGYEIGKTSFVVK